MPISSHIKSIFSKLRLLGVGSDRIMLSEREIFTLMHKSLLDINWSPEIIGFQAIEIPFPHDDYYQIPVQWFDEASVGVPSVSELIKAFDRAVQRDNDFALYFSNLCSLHKRRIKYQRILSRQQKPTMDQIGPRSLLEFGFCEVGFLASWMTWRKWIFDIDNRSAQETGYLFEPILASCIGGESVGARNSPIKRLDGNGNPVGKGRQIDCYDGANELAYEFKLRVTVAASGQGRFGEELSFPFECSASGLKPILIVLDPNRSNRLDELEQAFLNEGGDVYTGEDAWSHLEKKAGVIMSVFLEKYIRPALASVADCEPEYPSPLKLIWQKSKISIESGDHVYDIERHPKL